VSKYEEWPLISNSAIRLVSASARGGRTPPRYVWMTPSLRRTPVPGVCGTEAPGRTLRTLRWSSSMRRARQVATDRRHTCGAAATGRAMLSNQNNSVSVCNRVTMALTSPGVESEARAITKRKRRLDSGMAVPKLDSWTPSANKVQSTLLILGQQRPIPHQTSLARTITTYRRSPREAPRRSRTGRFPLILQMARGGLRRPPPAGSGPSPPVDRGVAQTAPQRWYLYQWECRMSFKGIKGSDTKL